ncbi:MAG TPA: RNA polymerase sigma factor RpoD/SigA [Candidatus Acidoferrum sp.]|nr:RNA polymerase sigma factor RpoD/SigA [Candidatus Acidoferrum sp.]
MENLMLTRDDEALSEIMEPPDSEIEAIASEELAIQADISSTIASSELNEYARRLPPMLTSAQERYWGHALLRPGQRAAAREALVMGNLRLAIHVALKYRNPYLDLMDLIQEGNIGLFKAAEKFDVRKGYRFSTYAMWWIRQAITRALADYARVIRLPVYKVGELRTAKRLLSLGMSKEAVAASLGITVEYLEDLLGVDYRFISIETPLSPEDPTTTIATTLADKPDEGLEMPDLQDDIKKCLKESLTPREVKVICLRFGIGYMREHTLEEVGREFKLTRERIRQIELRALTKLRRSSSTPYFRKLLDELNE